MIDPVALRSLVAVERLGSVGAAATALQYTPSAVSQQIKRLESQTGVQLLERRGRGVLLTEAGRSLTESARDLLAEMERLEARVRGIEGQPVGSVRLGVFATAYRGILPGALERLRASAPGVVLKADELDPWDAVDAVAAGSHDLAVVHNWEPLPLAIPSHLEIRHVGRDVADVLVHRTHRLADHGELSVQDVLEEEWVSVAPGSICHQWLVKMYADVGRAPRIGHIAQEFATHIALVGGGQVVALVPRLGRGELPDDVRAVPITQPLSARTVSVVWRSTMGTSPALHAVVEALSAESAQLLS
ncbi:MAG TPA: LysR family transcriptional regulator [Intrasporangium sp.]|uniref:LysR family transcriptional regulator n=1 Tax=Intrasporangium sp. TaxID=1925024 RepID=UPI002B491F5D|nr:LysR family transcriptional regulator [Intrasporangium sp.]HKX67564.1 LysR family transcriptional regulator [Intrasporangium sp.]